MLGEVIDAYNQDKIKVELTDGYVYPDYNIYVNNKLGEQGCLNEDLTAKELYNKLFSQD